MELKSQHVVLPNYEYALPRITISFLLLQPLLPAHYYYYYYYYACVVTPIIYNAYSSSKENRQSESMHEDLPQLRRKVFGKLLQSNHHMIRSTETDVLE